VKKILNAILLLAMVASMAVQYNDPDGIRWMFIYGFAAAMCANALGDRYNVPLLIIGLLGYVIGAVVLTPEKWDGWITNEIARETGGLGIAAFCLVVLLVQSFMAKPTVETPTEDDTTEE
jgi:hypothetical protein